VGARGGAGQSGGWWGSPETAGGGEAEKRSSVAVF
jgi:hypothetical protein